MKRHMNKMNLFVQVIIQNGEPQSLSAYTTLQQYVIKTLVCIIFQIPLSFYNFDIVKIFPNFASSIHNLCFLVCFFEM